MRVYTRTGNKGKTSLYQGKRVSKGSLRIEAIGTVDELNSVIGVGLAQIKNQPYVKDKLKRVQSDLFEIGAALANPSSRMDFKIKVKEFEKEIDNLTVKRSEEHTSELQSP